MGNEIKHGTYLTNLNAQYSHFPHTMIWVIQHLQNLIIEKSISSTTKKTKKQKKFAQLINAKIIYWRKNCSLKSKLCWCKKTNSWCDSPCKLFSNSPAFMCPGISACSFNNNCWRRNLQQRIYYSKPLLHLPYLPVQ